METHSGGKNFTPAFFYPREDFGDPGSFENQLQVNLVNLCKTIKKKLLQFFFLLEYDPFDIKRVERS